MLLDLSLKHKEVKGNYKQINLKTFLHRKGDELYLGKYLQTVWLTKGLITKYTVDVTGIKNIDDKEMGRRPE